MDTPELLAQIKARLQAAHGARLKGVILYGSRARGDAQPGSDWDVLVVLEGPIHLMRDIHTTTVALYPLVLELGILIDAIPADSRAFESQDYALYHVAKAEGIPA